MSTVAEAAGVSKWYGEVLGLNAFTASFGTGITGLVGPNGAGKSTLFKLLIGQLHANQGTLQLLGENPWNNVPMMRRLGYCPEHNQLYGWLSGQQCVEALLRLDGMPAAKASNAASAALKVVGLSAAAHRPTRTYSRGMRQRAKLAQALAHDPEVLILDEPLSGADPMARVQILRTIADFAKDGGHVLMSTHVLYEIERITNNIVLIHNGKAIASGDIHAMRALIDTHPHAVRLDTPRPRQLAQALARLDHVVSFEFPSAEELLVRTRKPDAFYRELPGIVADTKLEVRGIESPDDSLDAVVRVGGFGIQLFQILLIPLFFQLVLIFVTLVNASTLIRDEIEDNTLPYLLTRPISKPALVLYKYVAYLASALVLLVPPIVLAYGVTELHTESPFSADLDVLWGFLLTTILGSAAYGALFLFVSVLVRRPLAVGLLIGFLWESVVGSIPGDVRKLSVIHYLKSILKDTISVP